MNNKMYKKIVIYENENNNIFNGNYIFTIPIYQRNYEWDIEHIEQLIDDISSINNDENYYLGILVVDEKKKNNFEIIDGQQRLTTLFLIMNFLNLNIKNCLTFENRISSNRTLKHIKTFDKLPSPKLKNMYIYEKYNDIKNKFNKEQGKNKNYLDDFKKKLNQTILIVSQVPEYTDLNHYFEIMNIRGEQLKASDIIKSRLMSNLNTKAQTLFSEIWEACSDMNSYIQMNFNTKTRKLIFGNFWNNFLINDYNQLKKQLENYNEIQPKSYNILNIIKKENDIKANINLNNEGEIITSYSNKENFDIKYESIITFPVFLLHTLKVLIRTEIKKQELLITESDLIYEMLDDSKLIESFNNVLKNLDKLNMSQKEFSQKYIFYLLKTRFIFDKYIIKREFKEDIQKNNGAWSLKNIEKKSKSTYELKNTFSKYNENIRMLQSALRVSYTSPKVMHWITICLEYAFNNSNINALDYEEFIEKYIANEITENLKYKSEKDYYNGVNTPHIIFNYLDFLIWRKNDNPNIKCKNFEFEFRNSVEHFYPQNPIGFKMWNKKDLDYFGNLCLVIPSINSKFSNSAPNAKKSSFEKEINKGSLKLRLMTEKITEDKKTNDLWRNQLCYEHGKEMIELLNTRIKELNK